jgi:hypothetical protein
MASGCGQRPDLGRQFAISLAACSQVRCDTPSRSTVNLPPSSCEANCRPRHLTTAIQLCASSFATIGTVSARHCHSSNTEWCHLLTHVTAWLLVGTAPPPTVLSRLAAAAVAASYSGSSAAAAAAAAASRNTFAAWAERVQGDPRAAAQQVRV